nr:MAG TPA: hypothetical protein [Caudoviricetes sp.]
MKSLNLILGTRSFSIFSSKIIRKLIINKIINIITSVQTNTQIVKILSILSPPFTVSH